MGRILFKSGPIITSKVVRVYLVRVYLARVYWYSKPIGLLILGYIM